MRRTFSALAASLACAVAIPQPAHAAPATFSDSICPGATQYVVAVGRLTKDDPPAAVYAAAQAVVDAYGQCSKEKLSNAFREAQHYADTRAAQFSVLASRALIALGRVDDARRELKQYRAIAQNVVDWRSEIETRQANNHVARNTTGDAPMVLQSSSDSDAGKRPSIYHDTAKDVVAAIDAMLVTIDPSQPVPAPAASPHV
jgi:hypothetical protein